MNWVFSRSVSGSGISGDGKKRRKRGEGSRQKKKLACQGNEWCLWPCAFIQNHVSIYYSLFIAFKLKGLCHLLLIFMSLRSN